MRTIIRFREEYIMKRQKSILLLIILSVISIESKAQWEPVPSDPGGVIRDIVLNSNGEIYLASLNSGVYRSADSASTTPSTPPQ